MALATIPSIIDVASGLLCATIVIFLAIAVLEPLEPQRAAIKSKVDRLTQSNLQSERGWRPSSVKVVDGDTLEIAGTRFRLYGFDAPETRQSCKDNVGNVWACGSEATRELQTLIHSAERVTCDGTDKDQYGRTIAVCYADDVDTGSHLVSKGLAWAYTRYSSRYVSDERSARNRRVGIWQASNLPAWDWRRQN